MASATPRATTTTGVDGFYDFSGLTPGVQYQVTFTAPAGYLFTTQDVGANGFDTTDSDANAGTGKTQIVTLSSGEYNPTSTRRLSICTSGRPAVGRYQCQRPAG